MVSTRSTTGTWHPKTESEKQFVRAQLERLVSDRLFTASKRYPSMLRYIVEQTLADNEESLKERTLGLEVFHRPPGYDTNLDPVVRLSAAEVRKRLAQYYQMPAHDDELRIELNPGSYVPLFALPVADSPTIELTSADAPPAPERPVQPRQSLRLQASLVAAAVVIIVLISVTVVRHSRHPENPQSGLEKVWSPLLTSKKPILFCVGETKLFGPHDAPLSDPQSNPDDDSFLQAFADKNDFVPFPDVEILSRFVSLIGTRGHAFTVQNVRTTDYSQLREGPVVLIGALNNEWTLNRSSSLRFHLEGPEGADHIYWIEDRQHPDSRAWQVITLAPRSRVVKDYAIIARFTDQGTGQVVLIAAGIAGSGTRAAGEFLTNESSLIQLADGAPADWEQKNFEAVLSSEVVNGIPGEPKLEAKVFW